MTETGKFSFAKGAGGNWPYNKAAGKMQYLRSRISLSPYHRSAQGR